MTVTTPVELGEQIIRYQVDGSWLRRNIQIPLLMALVVTLAAILLPVIIAQASGASFPRSRDVVVQEITRAIITVLPLAFVLSGLTQWFRRPRWLALHEYGICCEAGCWRWEEIESLYFDQGLCTLHILSNEQLLYRLSKQDSSFIAFAARLLKLTAQERYWIAIKRFKSGDSVKFGHVIIDPLGIQLNKDKALWSDIDDQKFTASENLIMLRHRNGMPLMLIYPAWLPNCDILPAVISDLLLYKDGSYARWR